MATTVELPAGNAGPRPASLYRTAYGRDNPLSDGAGAVTRGLAAVTQDVRGRFASEGNFDLGGSDRDDGAAAVAWVAAQPWCDGRVAGRGLSYPGLMQWHMALARPAALRCIAPLIAPAWWRGMSFREGGALQLAFATHWLPLQAADAPGIPAATRVRLLESAFQFERVLARPDGGVPCVSPELALREPALNRHPLADPGLFEGAPPFDRLWAELFADDAPTGNWLEDTGPPANDLVDVPTLVMGGWYDLWSQDAIATFQHLCRTSPAGVARDHRLVLAPFGHGPGWVGEIPIGSDAMRFDCDLDVRWAAEWLRGAEPELRDLDPVTFYMYGVGWRGGPSWPPPGVTTHTFYLDADSGSLSDAPPARVSRATYTFDPRQPVPTRGGRLIGLPPGPAWQDGLTAGARADVLSFVSTPLAQDLDITGPVTATLFVRSSAAGTDFTAKLLDIHPDGRALAVCDGITRASASKAHHDGHTDAGQVFRVGIHLRDLAYRVPRGHRIGLDISSSNFPWYDVNPNTGATPGTVPTSEWRVARQELWSGAPYPSALQITAVSP